MSGTPTSTTPDCGSPHESCLVANLCARHRAAFDVWPHRASIDPSRPTWRCADCNKGHFGRLGTSEIFVHGNSDGICKECYEKRLGGWLPVHAFEREVVEAAKVVVSASPRSLVIECMFGRRLVDAVDALAVAQGESAPPRTGVGFDFMPAEAP